MSVKTCSEKENPVPAAVCGAFRSPSESSEFSVTATERAAGDRQTKTLRFSFRFRRSEQACVDVRLLRMMRWTVKVWSLKSPGT